MSANLLFLKSVLLRHAKLKKAEGGYLYFNIFPTSERGVHCNCTSYIVSLCGKNRSCIFRHHVIAILISQILQILFKFRLKWRIWKYLVTMWDISSWSCTTTVRVLYLFLSRKTGSAKSGAKIIFLGQPISILDYN